MQEAIQRLDNYGHGGGGEIPRNMRTPLARALSDYTPDTHSIIAGTQDGYTDPDGHTNILGRGDNAHAQICESERFCAAHQMARADTEPGKRQ